MNALMVDNIESRHERIKVDDDEYYVALPVVPQMVGSMILEGNMCNNLILPKF